VGLLQGWGVFGGVLLMASTFVYLSGNFGVHEAPAKANDFETSILILLVLGLCLRQFFAPLTQGGMLAISTTLFGLMYVPWLLNFIQKIHYYPRVEGNGAFYVLYFILVTKFSDTGAYAVGSLIGRHKMIPRISPGRPGKGLAGRFCFRCWRACLFYGRPGAVGGHDDCRTRCCLGGYWGARRWWVIWWNRCSSARRA
jgi:phosphatidate cytidylyltransferase